jgi:hypothetical protein
MAIPELNGYAAEIVTGEPTALAPAGEEGGQVALVYVLLFIRLSSVSVMADP